ncbi:3-deoxy-D-manno-octulosonic acid transferase [bacterium]|nr:3-deoxy-D-manno-octulosonic acid transferase [bacterium]
MYFLYNILLLTGAVVALPLFLGKMLFAGKYRKSFRGKLGFIPTSISDKMEGRPRIWINAVSVGEVIAVSSTARALREIYPLSCLILSTGTETGQEMAKKMVKEASTYIYCPLDFPWAARKVLDKIKPDLFITTETELWPNLLRMAKGRGAKTMLTNGRISGRSYGHYLRTRFFWRKVLENLDLLSMISDTDAERIKAMGARPERVFVSGNSKYDALVSQTEPRFEAEMRELLNISKEDKVFIAASTHRGEEETVLQAYRKFREKFPRMLLIIAPRHIERAREVKELLKKEHFNSYIQLSEIKEGKKRTNQPIIILDTIGDLFKVYSLRAIVFCGGSFVPKGGQNILEPAAWGRVVFYGSSMGDFLEAKELLEEVGAGIPLRNVNELIEKGLELLSNPDELKRRGEAGSQTIMAKQGAAKRSAELATTLLKQ